MLDVAVNETDLLQFAAIWRRFVPEFVPLLELSREFRLRLLRTETDSGQSLRPAHLEAAFSKHLYRTPSRMTFQSLLFSDL